MAVHPRIRRTDARSGPRRHRQHRLDGDRAGERAGATIRRGEVRHPRYHQVLRARVRADGRSTSSAPASSRPRPRSAGMDWRGRTPRRDAGATPMGRIPGPEELAGTALFLATDDAAHMTGVYLGGRRRLQHGRSVLMDDIGLDAARELVRRAIDKAEQLGISGAIAVVGASGALVTSSRHGRGRRRWHGPGAVQGLDRGHPEDPVDRAPAPHDVDRTAGRGRFRGGLAGGGVPRAPGGMPIRDKSGRIVGGIAASGATVSPFFPPGHGRARSPSWTGSRPTPRTR